MTLLRSTAGLAFVVLVACGTSTQGTASTESAPSATSIPTAPPAMTEEPRTEKGDGGMPLGLFGGDGRVAAAQGDASPSGGTALDKARETALEGRPAETRQLLETKVRSGHATLEEARLVRAACKKMGDTACKADIESKYPSIKP